MSDRVESAGVGQGAERGVAARSPVAAAGGPSDADLMASLARGQMAALGQLVVRHQGRVRALAYRVLGHRDGADDVCQEAFLRVYRSAASYRPQAAFGTWLYRIVVNLCLDRTRRPRLASMGEEEPAPAGEGADAGMIRRERIEAVRRAVAGLPERQRVAVILHRYERMGNREIAASTGWTESAVESLLVRAYATLRADLKDWVDEPP